MSADRDRVLPESDRVEVARLNTLAEIRAFSAEWDRLLDADPHARLFQSPQIFSAWQEAAESPAEPWFLVARRNGDVVGCAPLVRRSVARCGLPFNVLSFGQPRGDLIIAQRRQDVVDALSAYVRDHAREWDLLAFDDVPAASGTVQALERTLPARDGYRRRETEQAPSETYLAATTSWDDYLQRRGAHFRHRLKPNCKRIERLGTVSYRWYRGPERAESVFDAFLRMEEASWKATTGVRLSPQEREGFRVLVRDRSGRLRADIVFLDVDGRPVSAMLSLLHRRCYYVFVTFFDERLRDLQPGRPLFREVLRYAFESPAIDEVSFVGSYSSASSWSLDTREYRNVRIYGRKLMGILAERMDRWEGKSGFGDANEARDD